jgi:hypothetical protein
LLTFVAIPMAEASKPQQAFMCLLRDLESRWCEGRKSQQSSGFFGGRLEAAKESGVGR